MLSRVDGSSNLETLCLISGLGPQVTCQILRRLADLGLISIGAGAGSGAKAEPSPAGGRRKSTILGAGPSATSPRPSATSPRTSASQAGSSERPVSAGQGAAGSSPPTRRVRAQTPPFIRIPAEAVPTAAIAEARREPPTTAAVPEARREPPTERSEKPMRSTPPVGIPLEELPDEPDVELKPEVRAAILFLHRRLGELSFFQLLDVDPDAELITIRRAYFKRSKDFHPDRYFRKQIGRYKAMLDEIFKQISAAYHFLEDDSQRQAYREMVKQEIADAAVLAEVEAQGARALEDDAGDDRAELSPLASGAASPRLRIRSGTRPKFPWEVRPPTPAGQPVARSPTGPAEPAVAAAPPLSSEEQRAREERRNEDRRRRLRKLTEPMVGEHRKVEQFREQGLRQLAAGQVLAAAASLKLALTFGGESAEVRKAYEEALERSRSQTGENYFKRAVFEESVGRLETAHKYFVQAADAHPTAVYLTKAAEAVMASGDLIKARDYATRAVQTDPKFVDARIALARLYEEAGMKKNARRELEEALRLEPGNTAAKDLLKSVKSS